MQFVEYKILHMMSLGTHTEVETSSEVAHHSHGHSWCYLLDTFPNRLLPRHLKAYERSLAVQVVFSSMLILWRVLNPFTSKSCSD